MIYLADTANIEEIKDLFNYYPMEGVTTNPTILSKEDKKLSVIIPEILACIGNKMIHIQTISENSDDILLEAKRLCKNTGNAGRLQSNTYGERCGNECYGYSHIYTTTSLDCS